MTAASDAAQAWSPWVTRVLAPNPSPLTLQGTNTYVVGRPDGTAVVVIDPGPDLERHKAALAAACAGRRVEAVLLTHTHADHSQSARQLASAAHAPLLAVDPPWATAGQALTDGAELTFAAVPLLAVTTPGHAADHCCFWLGRDAALFTGDHVLGHGSTFVEWPGGSMADYMASLEKLFDLPAERLYPGHGPLVTDARGKIEEYIAHRRARETQVMAALRAGDRSPGEVVARVYADVDPLLHPAAERSVRAHLDKLVTDGAVRVVAGGFEPAV